MKGFSLVEMLVTLSLGLLVVTLMFNVYDAQLNIHHKIEDMVFLDHNGVLAMKILKNEHKKGEFIVKKHGLWYKRAESKGGPQEIVSGVESLSDDKERITIEIKAPHGMAAKFSEKIPEGALV